MEDKIKILENDNKRLRMELAQTANDTNNIINNTSNECEIDVDKYEEKISKLESKLNTYEEKIISNEEKIKSQEKEIMKLKVDLNDIKNEKDQYERLYKDVKEQSLFFKTLGRSIRIDESALLDDALRTQMNNIEEFNSKFAVDIERSRQLQYVYNEPIGLSKGRKRFFTFGF